MLPDDIRCANETRDLIMECCVGASLDFVSLSLVLRVRPKNLAEFVHLVSSEANEICNKENKKTIAPDHVLKALTVRTRLPSFVRVAHACVLRRRWATRSLWMRCRRCTSTTRPRLRYVVDSLCRHIGGALTCVGFQEKPKGTRKLESLGIPEEELLKQQQKLFEKARTELRKSQEASTAAAAIAAAHASAQSAAAAGEVKKESS